MLQTRLAGLLCSLGQSPDASIVIPVNAHGDLENVLHILSDLGCYSGLHKFDVTLVVNNYEPDAPPNEIEDYMRLGLTVVAVPNLRQRREAVALTARVRGARSSATDNIIHFDADCRILNATALLDWYVEQFRGGAKVAYSQVGFYDLRDNWPNRVRTMVPYTSRWFKRVVLRIPTTRGSNYGVNRTQFLAVYDDGMLADELNVGPTIKWRGGRIVYCGSPELLVLTSGRMFSGKSWLRLVRYLLYRLRYNLRLLPVRSGMAAISGRENDPIRSY